MNLSILDGRTELWQWDTGIRLVMDEACEAVNISASTFGVSVDVTAAEDGKTWVATVPDEMLQVPGDLICYAVQSTDTGTITAAYRSFRINRRPKPYGYVATPTEARTWKELDDKKIDAPHTAAVGEVLTVEEIGEDGKPTKWKTAPAATEQKQANWAQNDETAADYVKNRPGGYYGDPVTVDEEIYSGEIKQAATEMLMEQLLVAGQTYKVTIGGVDKTYTAFADTFQGVSGVTIGDAPLMDAYTSGGGVWAMLSAESKGDKFAIMISLEEDVGKSIRIAHVVTLREVYKIPAELLDIPPVEQEPQVVTVTLVERDGKQYGSMPFNEVLAAQRSGKEVRLLDGSGHYYQLTGIYNADGDICFHSFRLRTLWIAIMDKSGVIEIFDHSIGQQELTYDAGDGYLSLSESANVKLGLYSSTTRNRYLINIKLKTKTTGAYIQLKYYKQTKTIKLCKHEDLGNDGVVLDMELNRVSTNDTSYLVTMHLLNSDGTAHASGYYYCGELDLESEDGSAEIWIASGTTDNLTSRLTYKSYYR